MLCDEDCRAAGFGKTERPVGWEGDGEPAMIELLRHCIDGNWQSTDRLRLKLLNHSFTLDLIHSSNPLPDGECLGYSL
jgi:hypothetical protein